MIDKDIDARDRAVQPSGSFAKYILVFAAFGLFGLVVMANKYEHRQTKIEQRFHGIEHMQRDAGGAGEAGQGGEVSPDQQPLLITLRPLMIVLGMVMMIAWLFVMRFGNRY
ncbi:MAG: hypothetical protein WBF93_02305 [Pirellulales bacterium]